jgi:glutamyl-tRNA reductase
VSTLEEPRVAALVAATPEVDVRTRADALDEVRHALAEAPGVLLATCHRVEWWSEELPPIGVAAMRPYLGIDAARHIIRLAIGLDSTVMSEDQILHQLRAAVADARRRGPLATDLQSLLDHALRAGRTGRSWRPPMPTSLADVALDRIEAAVGPLAGRRVLVVGTGTMGQLVARGALARRAGVTVASRTRLHAAALAAELPGARDVDLDPGRDELANADAIVVALGGRWALGPSSGAALAGCRLVVDLSMPPALDGATMTALGSRGLDIDGLGPSQSMGVAGRRYRDRLEVLATATLDAYLGALADRRRSRAARLAARVEDQRQAALAAYLRERPDLDDAAREELERLTRRLSARLFREPLARLAVDPDGRRGRALDELFGA